jgi:hypothetical protein
MAANLTNSQIETLLVDDGSALGALQLESVLQGLVSASQRCDLGETPVQGSVSSTPSATTTTSSTSSVAVAEGGCPTVDVAGGSAYLTITDHEISCAAAVRLTRAFVANQAGHFGPGSELAATVDIDGWNCGADPPTLLSCEVGGTETRGGTYFFAAIHYTVPTTKPSTVRPTVAASRFVAKLDALFAGQPPAAQAVELCYLGSSTADLTIYLGSKVPCGSLLPFANAAYGANSWSLVSSGVVSQAISNADGKNKCGYMGQGHLTDVDNIDVTPVSGSTATEICTALTATGNWTPQAG